MGRRLDTRPCRVLVRPARSRHPPRHGPHEVARGRLATPPDRRTVRRYHPDDTRRMRQLSHERTLVETDLRFFQSMRVTAAQLQPYIASVLFAMIPVIDSGLGTFAVDRHWRVYLDME